MIYEAHFKHNEEVTKIVTSNSRTFRRLTDYMRIKYYPNLEITKYKIGFGNLKNKK